MKKTLFTLNVDNYAPQIRELTYPLLKGYAKKIDAEFVEINERAYPDMPPVYEKIQIYDLAKIYPSDWYIYIDADALIHPEMFDVTALNPKDTVMHFGNDFSTVRFRSDEYFLRDGRHFGSGNWFTVASDWCLDLWHPLDIPLSEAEKNIHLSVAEMKSGCMEPKHLIDDYTLSRNIARYGLKATTMREWFVKIGRNEIKGYAWHQYLTPIGAKIIEMNKVLKAWGLK